jgi:hypothetical protein
MEKEETTHQRDPSRNMAKSLLVLGGAITAATLLWKNKRKSTDDILRFDPDAPVPTLPRTNPYESSTFHQLLLPKEHYDVLKNYGGGLLVFQFFYPKANNCGSPTLFAYSRKSDRSPTGKPPVILGYGEESKEPIKGRSQVLGDHQIKIERIESLIKRVTGNRKGEFKYLVFNPVFISSNPHLAYQISVDGSRETELANPSPPG